MNDIASEALAATGSAGTDATDLPSVLAESGFAADVGKRWFDIVVSLTLLLLVLPILALVIVALLLAQGRPVFVANHRVGRNGKAFGCLKFRTMVVDADRVLEQHLQQDPAADREWTLTRKLRHDPRVTPIGRTLRRSSVDELPQFLNVLRGDMSLVGPRPIFEEELSYYGPFVQKYLQVRPGLTGLWQISGRSDLSYGTRVKLDVSYVDGRSFITDISILLRTIPAVLRARGAC